MMVKKKKKEEKKVGIFETKGGFKVKSYYTGKFHRTPQGKIKVYKTKKDAITAAGMQYKKYGK